MTAACENPEDAAVFLQELREISNKHSIYSNHSKPSNQKLRPQTCSSSGKENSDNPIIDSKCGDIDGNNFLNQIPENRELNQYWYSKNTIKALCDTIRESLTVYEGKRVAFLSTPSLFFSLTVEEREYCTLFDFDTSWESCPGYHFYDYNNPTDIEDNYHGKFDLVVIDPPFISQAVWEMYAATAHLLMKDGNSRVIATTVDENCVLMNALFNCKPVLFRPSIPHLVYQYSVYTNFPSMALSDKNPELKNE